jgi:DNA-binding MarR family transcriptional regulator
LKRPELNPDEIKELYRLSVLIKQTDNAIQKSRENELRKSGITPEQAAALICIRSLCNRATPAEISRWLFRDESSTLVLIRRMIKQGLTIKTTDPNNKHLIIIRLTRKGSSGYKNAIKFLSLQDIFCHLAKERRELLYSLIGEIRLTAFSNLGLNADTYSGLFSEELILSDDRANPKTRETPDPE